MKRLGLLRHAKSDWEDPVKRDFDRGLNDRGRRGAALIGEHISAEDWAWDLVIASPAVRVKQTLENARLGVRPVFDDKLYLASPETILETIGAHTDEGSDDPKSILIVGHNPGLQETILNLVSPAHENDHFREASIKFPTASFAVLECNTDNWRGLKNYCAKLVHLARPRDLDAELGPEH